MTISIHFTWPYKLITSHAPCLLSELAFPLLFYIIGFRCECVKLEILVHFCCSVDTSMASGRHGMQLISIHIINAHIVHVCYLCASYKQVSSTCFLAATSPLSTPPPSLSLQPPSLSPQCECEKLGKSWSIFVVE